MRLALLLFQSSARLWGWTPISGPGPDRAP